MATRKTPGKTTPKTETRTKAVKREALSVANELVPVPIAASVVSQDAIANLAYELFLQRGSQHGYDVDDWMAAERILSER